MLTLCSSQFQNCRRAHPPRTAFSAPTSLPQQAHPAPRWLPPLHLILPTQGTPSGCLSSPGKAPEVLLGLRLESVFVRQPHSSWERSQEHKDTEVHGCSRTHCSLQLQRCKCIVGVLMFAHLLSPASTLTLQMHKPENSERGLGFHPAPWQKAGLFVQGPSVLFELCEKRHFHTSCLAPS